MMDIRLVNRQSGYAIYLTAVFKQKHYYDGFVTSVKKKSRFAGEAGYYINLRNL